MGGGGILTQVLVEMYVSEEITKAISVRIYGDHRTIG